MSMSAANAPHVGPLQGWPDYSLSGVITAAYNSIPLAPTGHSSWTLQAPSELAYNDFTTCDGYPNGNPSFGYADDFTNQGSLSMFRKAATTNLLNQSQPFTPVHAGSDQCLNQYTKPHPSYGNFVTPDPWSLSVPDNEASSSSLNYAHPPPWTEQNHIPPSATSRTSQPQRAIGHPFSTSTTINPSFSVPRQSANQYQRALQSPPQQISYGSKIKSSNQAPRGVAQPGRSRATTRIQMQSNRSFIEKFVNKELKPTEPTPTVQTSHCLDSRHVFGVRPTCPIPDPSRYSFLVARRHRNDPDRIPFIKAMGPFLAVSCKKEGSNRELSLLYVHPRRSTIQDRSKMIEFCDRTEDTVNAHIATRWPGIEPLIEQAQQLVETPTLPSTKAPDIRTRTGRIPKRRNMEADLLNSVATILTDELSMLCCPVLDAEIFQMMQAGDWPVNNAKQQFPLDRSFATSLEFEKMRSEPRCQLERLTPWTVGGPKRGSELNGPRSGDNATVSLAEIDLRATTSSGGRVSAGNDI